MKKHVYSRSSYEIHTTTDRPQELDEEDEHFLLEHIEKERLKEIERRREEESHLAAFGTLSHEEGTILYLYFIFIPIPVRV